MRCSGPDAGCSPPPSCGGCEPRRWRWAAAPPLDGILGDREGQLGASKEWAAAWLCRHLLLLATMLWLAAHSYFGRLRWFSSLGSPGLEQVRPEGWPELLLGLRGWGWGEVSDVWRGQVGEVGHTALS